MEERIQLTKEGKAQLEKELEELISRRGEVAQALANARSYGDLSENAEYDAAKRSQLDLEKRVQEITRILNNAEIISTRSRSSVAVGNKVELIADRKTVVYQLVGSVEANPAERKISDQSPIGKALLGKKVGEEVIISLPAGDKKYKVKSIS